MSPFLTFVCRACHRPHLLAKALKSLEVQTSKDFEVIFIIDQEKRGVAWANEQFSLNLHRVDGRYVYPLDDDTTIGSNSFVARLKTTSQDASPAVMVVKAKRPQAPPKRLPAFGVWGNRDLIRPRAINGGCFVTRQDVWAKHCHAFAHGSVGAGKWAMTLKNDSDLDFVWVDTIGLVTLQLGRGKRFGNSEKWWENTLEAFPAITEVSSGDWRLQPWLVSQS